MTRRGALRSMLIGTCIGLAVAWSAAAGTRAAGTDRPDQIRIIDAGPMFTRADTLKPASRPARLHATFTPNGDGRRDVAWLRACVPAGMRPARVVLLRAHRLYFTKISTSSSAVRMLGRSRLCARGQVMWRASWSGSSEQLGASRLPGGAYWMTLCMREMGWDPESPAMHAKSTGCASNPIVVDLMHVRIWAPWTVSHVPGELVPVRVETDAARIDAQLVTTDGRVVRRWRSAKPELLRLRVPRLTRGDVLRLRVQAGAIDRVDVPIVARSVAALARPAPRTALVVMPSLTWLAYNWSDVNGDGRPDTWYAAGLIRDRAYVPIAAPMVTDQRFSREKDARWTDPFFVWLARAEGAPAGDVQVQVITDLELEQLQPDVLRRYAVIVFPGHSEYYTGRMYDLLLEYRQLGGDLMFLQANSFYRRVAVDRRHDWIRGAWNFEAPCKCSRTVRFSDYEMSGVGFAGLDFHTRSPLALAVGAAQVAGLLDGVQAGPGGPLGTSAGEFDAAPPASHPSASIFTPIWHDVLDPERAVGGVMHHSSGAITFATGNMSFMSMMLSEATPLDERLALQQVLANMYVQLAER